MSDDTSEESEGWDMEPNQDEPHFTLDAQFEAEAARNCK